MIHYQRKGKNKKDSCANSKDHKNKMSYHSYDKVVVATDIDNKTFSQKGKGRIGKPSRKPTQ